MCIRVCSNTVNKTVQQWSQTRGPRPHVSRGAFWKISHNQHLSYLVYLPVFKSSQLASEQVPFKRIWRLLEMI